MIEARFHTCQGLSQSRGMGHTPNQAPITAPCAGKQIIKSMGPIGLQVDTEIMRTAPCTVKLHKQRKDQ